MTINELIEQLQAFDNGTERLMLGVKPFTGKPALLIRREPWADDVLIWDGE